MRYFADYIKGKPYQKTVLWENSNTSAVFDAQIVTLEDSISNYDEIGIYYKVSRSDNDSSAIPVFMNVDDFKKTSSTGDSFIFGNTIVIGSFGYGRMIYYVSDTSIQIMTCYKFNASASSNYNAIPVKIIGIKKGLGETLEYETVSFMGVYIGTGNNEYDTQIPIKDIVSAFVRSENYQYAGFFALVDGVITWINGVQQDWTYHYYDCNISGDTLKINQSFSGSTQISDIYVVVKKR